MKIRNDKIEQVFLSFLRSVFLSYRNQSIDLPSPQLTGWLGLLSKGRRSCEISMPLVNVNYCYFIICKRISLYSVFKSRKDITWSIYKMQTVEHVTPTVSFALTFNMYIHCCCCWCIVFVVWLTDERCLALFPAGNIVSEIYTIANLRHAACRIWTCAEICIEVVQ